MAEDFWSIRRATADDEAFMTDMLVEAVNWSPQWKRQSRSRVLATRRSAHYIVSWPRDTDLGVIAEADGEPMGAAWLRFLTAADPGYGFVAADVPELTLGVALQWRGRGVGRALLRAIAEHARLAGIGQISLSVERKNFAHKLYLSEGYQIVDSSGRDSDTMVNWLAPAGTVSGAGNEPAFRASQAVDSFRVRRENPACRPCGESLAKEAIMKYVIAWKPRYGGSAAENEATAARVLEVFSKWTPSSNITIHQFVLRVDGAGGFAVTEGDDPASGALDVAKFSPFLDYTIYPVLDVAEAAAIAAEAVEWRKSIT